MNRKYRLSKRIQIKEVAGNYISMYVFNDLTDSDLHYQFKHYLECEDFEYVEQIVAEAALRGIKFKIKKK